MALFDSKYTPWLIGGAVIVGGYLLFAGGSSSASSGGTTGYSPAELDLVALQANLSAQTEAARISAESTDTATLANLFANLMGAKYNNDQVMAQVAAGVQTTQIQTNGAIAIERDNNQTQRTAIRNATYQVVNGNSTQLQIASIQANTQRQIAQLQAAIQSQNQLLGFLGSAISPILGAFGMGPSPGINNGYANAAQNAGGG